ncbi:ComF family protein [soil metagenome]
MLDTLRQLGHSVLDLVYPPACLHCHISLPATVSPFNFCTDCLRDLTVDPHLTCPRCSSTVGPGTDTAKGCYRCRDHSFAFTSSQRLGPYDGKLRDAILRMKYLTGETLAESLGLLWADTQRERLLATQPQLILPVPLHWTRRIRRGYNQSASLAYSLAKSLQLPCKPSWVRLNRQTKEQTTLSATARRESVKGAFRLSRSARVQGVRVLLIDDVLTTGATADAAAKAILQGGAAQVTVAVLAHR